MTDNNIFHMNRLFIALLCLTIGTSMHAQMKPPQQTDTLSITAVKYNFTDIRPVIWPCNLIYKSTIYFQFGEEVFDIVDVSQSIFDKYTRLPTKNNLEHTNSCIMKLMMYSLSGFLVTPSHVPNSVIKTLNCNPKIMLFKKWISSQRSKEEISINSQNGYLKD